MRPIIFKLFILCIMLVPTVKVAAQTCKGSLGDPVINMDFGSGAGPGGPLPAGMTNYNFVSGDCPNDGSYTIANKTSNCFGSTWQNIPHDHTGNTNGYMMLINASNSPGLFFVQQTTAGALCPNTTYEFSAWILNLIVSSACGGNSSKPNITFSIETPSGTLLKKYDTGDIAFKDVAEWNKYGTFFTTPPGVTDVVVKMTNNAPGGCGNDLALDDITFRPCGPVIQTGFSSETANAPQDICEGDNKTFNIVANVGDGYSNPQLQWQKNSGNGWTDIPNQKTNNLTVVFSSAITGTYQYRLAVGEGNNINSTSCRVYSDPLTVNVNPLPKVLLTAPEAVCEADTLKLLASGGSDYTWNGPGIINSHQNPLIIPNAQTGNAGTYTVVATSAQGCNAAPMQATVRILPKVTAVVSADPAPICEKESVQLNASGGTIYAWSPSKGLDHADIPNPIASPDSTTTYTVRVSNGGCYEDSKPVTVTVLKNPVAMAGSTIKIFEGQSAKLNGKASGDNITYRWTPVQDIDDPTSLTATVNPTNDTRYTLTVTSPTCGTDTSSVFVRVYKKITIPNTFSPNNDGVNDKWNIEALITYPESKMMIFNRYGEKVFESTGYSKPWDGTQNGSVLPVGSYYYLLDLKNKTPKISGWVFIAR